MGTSWRINTLVYKQKWIIYADCEKPQMSLDFKQSIGVKAFYN